MMLSTSSDERQNCAYGNMIGLFHCFQHSHHRSFFADCLFQMKYCKTVSGAFRIDFFHNRISRLLQGQFRQAVIRFKHGSSIISEELLSVSQESFKLSASSPRRTLSLFANLHL